MSWQMLGDVANLVAVIVGIGFCAGVMVGVAAVTARAIYWVLSR